MIIMDPTADTASANRADAACYTCPKCRQTTTVPQQVTVLWCPHCKISADTLLDTPITQFPWFKPIVTKRQCFTAAFLTLLEWGESEGWLVHGWMPDPFEPERLVQHAWCEFPVLVRAIGVQPFQDTLVIDYTQIDERAVYVPIRLFYHLMAPRGMRYFSCREAIIQSARHKNYGPWPEASVQ